MKLTVRPAAEYPDGGPGFVVARDSDGALMAWEEFGLGHLRGPIEYGPSHTPICAFERAADAWCAIYWHSQVSAWPLTPEDARNG